MTGLNHVRSGGPPRTLDLSASATLVKVSVGRMDNNAYLLTSGGRSVLIDAADDVSTLIKLAADLEVDTIVTTHQHRDHWQALAEVAGATGAALIAGRPDVGSIADGAGVPAPDPVWDGDKVPLGSESLEVIGLVGHTPGSITLVYSGGDAVHLFTGDSLFPGGPGKTGSPADFASLMDDLQTKIFDRFSDDTVVHPGHGDDTTLGAERPHLDGWRTRGW